MRFMNRTTLLIDGSFCYPCTELLLKKVKTVSGVVDIKINIVAGLLILYSEGDLNIMEAQRAIEAAGFRFLRKVEG
jgi:hypothetical protein